MPKEAVGQHADHVFAQILQQLRVAIHHADLDAQRGEYRDEFAGDHAAAHDRQAVRQVAEIEDRGGIEHDLFIERDIGRAARPGAGGQNDDLGRDAARVTGRVGDLHGVRIGKRRFARNQRDTRTQQALQDDRFLLRDHHFLAPHRIGQ